MPLISAWALLVCAVMAASAQDVSPLALGTELLALRKAGWEAAYRTDYQHARASFAELQRRAPNHPDGDLSMASTIWQEYLFNTRRLQSDLYKQSSSFYNSARASSENAEGDPMDAAIHKTFQEHLSRGLAKAQAALESYPNDVEALYFLGSAYGVRAAYEASAQRRFWAALRDGIRAVKLHQRVLELDPKFYDAYLALGVFHYALGHVPQPFRGLAAMVGIRGSKKQGIAELELAKQKASYNRDDASAVLVAVYRYESNPQLALAELEALSTRYPQNVPLRIEMASTLAQLRRDSSAAVIFQELLDHSDRRLADFVHFQYAEALARNHAYTDAAFHFSAVEHVVDAYSPLVAQALVRAGQTYDLLGRRSEAIQSYKASLAYPLSEDSLKTVDKLIRQPFRMK